MKRLARLASHFPPQSNCKDTAAATAAAADAIAKEDVFVLSAVRTPMGGFGGSLSGLQATELGSIVIREALKKSGVRGDQVKEVFMGNVLGAGLGQAPARQAALKAGVTKDCPCTTVNKVCASGMKAIDLAASNIRLGKCDVAVAGGMESMSQAPYLMPKARFGARMGNTKMVDSMINDGLTDAYNHKAMGFAGELCAREMKISREEQDAYAQRSYKRAKEAFSKGRFKEEIVPITIKGKRKSNVIDTDDESHRKIANITKLRPAFDKKTGTITAMNASTISDGAAAVVLVSGKWLSENEKKPLCKLVACADAAQEPMWFTTSPAKATVKVLDRANLSLDQIDLFEFNEAFSVVAVANQRILGLDAGTMNVNGGAVSLGHPLGCSGTRIVVTLIHALRSRGKRYGLAAICNGGGGASALVIDCS